MRMNYLRKTVAKYALPVIAAGMLNMGCDKNSVEPTIPKPPGRPGDGDSTFVLYKTRAPIYDGNIVDILPEKSGAASTGDSLEAHLIN